MQGGLASGRGRAAVGRRGVGVDRVEHLVRARVGVGVGAGFGFGSGSGSGFGFGFGFGFGVWLVVRAPRWSRAPRGHAPSASESP